MSVVEGAAGAEPQGSAATEDGGSQKAAESETPRSVTVQYSPIKVTKAGRKVQAVLARLELREQRSRASSENSSELSTSPSRSVISPVRKTTKTDGRKRKRLEGYHQKMVTDLRTSFDDAVQRNHRREERRKQELQKVCYDLGEGLELMTEVNHHLMEAAHNQVGAVQKRHQKWERKWQHWSENLNKHPLGPLLEDAPSKMNQQRTKTVEEAYGVKLPPIRAARSPQLLRPQGPTAPQSTRPFMRRKYAGVDGGPDRQNFTQMATLLAQVGMNTIGRDGYLSCWQNGTPIPSYERIPLGVAVEIS